MKLYFCTILFLLVSTTSIATTEYKYNSGFQEIIISDQTRPLNIAIWYPTLDKQPIEKIADNPIFEGKDAIRNASLANYSSPLVLISHGLGGSWYNQAWLANALSQHGYIVVVPNHPGTTTKNMDRNIAQNMLQRPKDISRTITYLLSDKNFSEHIDTNKISIIGHSYGGWTAIEVIGGRFSAEQFNQECQSYPYLESCKIYHKQMQGLTKNSNYFKLDKDMRDPRISTAFIFDLGFARGFIPSSLSNINIPILVVSSGDFDKNLPIDLESQYLIQYLPSTKTEYLQLNNATHFSFTAICKPNAIGILKQQQPDDSYICEEDMNNREIIHQLLIEKIISYIDSY